jgi:hypothetical protein
MRRGEDAIEHDMGASVGGGCMGHISKSTASFHEQDTFQRVRPKSQPSSYGCSVKPHIGEFNEMRSRR